MFFTIGTLILITNLMFPELSLSLYDRRLQFLEYSVRFVLSMLAVVFIQTSAHFITKSVYVPIAFGCIITLLTDGIYNPFFKMLRCFESNVPLF